MVRAATHWPSKRPHPDPLRIVAISASIALNAALLALLMRPPEMVLPPADSPHIQSQIIDVRPLPKPKDPLPIQKPRSQPVHEQHQAVQPQKQIAQVFPQDATPVSTKVDPDRVVDTVDPVKRVISAPVEASLTPIAAPAPTYPRDALRDGIVGTVELELLVDVDGRVLQVRITHTSGSHVLDNAARDQVLRYWRFRPALSNGVAVQALGRVPIVFTLDGR